MNHPVLGIIGGVGPLATAYFMELIIRRTPAACDQDNIPMIVFNDPQIPDRTSYILDRSNPNPLPEMAMVATRLEEMGAEYLAVPCNTSYYFYRELTEATGLPVLNMPDETAAYIERASQELKTPGDNPATYAAAKCSRVRVGLMATAGTIASGVYGKYLEKHGLELVTPTPEDQAVVTHLIYDCVKAGLEADVDEFLGVAERMRKLQGCDYVIVGCTELSVIYQDLKSKPSFLVDAMDMLAMACVRHYQEKRSPVNGVETTR